MLSRRDVRAIVERVGGTFSAALTPRTTLLVTGQDAGEVPVFSGRVLTEAQFCEEAGLPDLETLQARYYSARDLRGMYPTLRDEHLRCLEKWGLVRPVVGRYSFSDLHVLKQAAAEIDRGASLRRVQDEPAWPKRCTRAAGGSAWNPGFAPEGDEFSLWWPLCQGGN